MVMTDHVIMGDRTDRYPYGEFPSPPETPWYDPLITLASIASVTSHIRLSTSVLISPLRSPVVLAKMIATLDQLSKGRVDLGVGTGWQREEYQAVGIPFAGRGQRMQDQLRACQTLWRDCPASFSSETVSFDQVYCRPEPAQKDGIPLWFGMAPTEVNCQRIAQLGVGWLPIEYDPNAIAEGVTALRAAFKANARDPSELQVRAQLLPQFNADGSGDLAATLAQMDKTIAAGATHIEILPFLFAQSAEQLRPCLEQIIKIKGS
jgi:probable F420-dependent oxidoreductase